MAAVAAKRAKEVRYQRTAREFKRWLVDNPSATNEKRIKMFNSIADSEYHLEQDRKIGKSQKKVVNRI